MFPGQHGSDGLCGYGCYYQVTLEFLWHRASTSLSFGVLPLESDGATLGTSTVPRPGL
jgi:hypothetical protein